MRGTKGYGFSVHGHNPVYITDVVDGSIIFISINCLNHYPLPHTTHTGLPAAESDIRVGDIIVEVESTDVTRANGDLVVSIVRYLISVLFLFFVSPLIVAKSTIMSLLSTMM